MGNRKIFVSLSLILLSLTTVAISLGNAQETTTPDQPFSDIDPYSAYYDATLYLKNKGVIQGYEDGTFKPTQKVNRAEALKIILLGSQKEIPEPHAPLPFSDTGSGSWYTPYVASGVSYGIVQGYPDGTFKPEQTVNKVESLKMLLKTNDITPPNITLSTPSLFEDTLITDSTLWYQPFVFYSRQTNIVDPKNIYTFGPADNMTRGQVAVMMYRLSYIQEHQLEYFDTTQLGIASYYGSGLEGHGTASGESFSNDDFSSAHRNLPFNTFLEVINTNTGISVIVKVNDRGPYVEGRVVDLSQSAFSAIEKLSRGLVNVKVRRIGVIPNITKSYIDPTTFSTNTNSFSGVLLDKKIPNLYVPYEIYTVTGSTVNNAQTVTVVMQNKETKQESFFSASVYNQRFSLPFMLTTEGQYTMNIIPDTTGIGYADLYVTKASYFDNKLLLTNNNAPQTPQITYNNGKTTVTFEQNGNNIFQLRFVQDSKEMILYANNTLPVEIPYFVFEHFTTAPITMTIAGARSSSDFSLDRYTEWAVSSAITFTPTHHEYEIYKKDKVVMTPFTTMITGNNIHLTGTAKTNLEREVWYTMPDGTVKNINISGTNINESFDYTIPVTEQGTYIVEMNDMNGEAVFNVPFYLSGSIPLLPSIRDTDESQLMDSLNVANERTTMLNLINQERAKIHMSNLSLSINANNLAQARSDDMVLRNYFAHITPEGNTAEDLKDEYGLTGTIGENLAKDNNTLLALYGLLRSPAHRSLLMSDMFATIGIGITKAQDGQIIVTQIFN